LAAVAQTRHSRFDICGRLQIFVLRLLESADISPARRIGFLALCVMGLRHAEHDEYDEKPSRRRDMHLEHPSKVVPEGDSVVANVLRVDVWDRRIGLSLKRVHGG